MATAGDPTSMARRNVHRPITNIMGLLASGMASGQRLYRIGGGEGSSDETSRRRFRPGQGVAADVPCLYEWSAHWLACALRDIEAAQSEGRGCQAPLPPSPG